MKLLVIDASAVVEQASKPDGFGVLRRYRLVAPPVMWSEAVSAIRSAVFRGEASPALAEQSIACVLEAPIERRAPRALYREAYRIATDLGWAKTYDAEYLALARFLDARLLTTDERLQRGGARVATVVGPNEL